MSLPFTPTPAPNAPESFDGADVRAIFLVDRWGRVFQLEPDEIETRGGRLSAIPNPVQALSSFLTRLAMVRILRGPLS